MAGDAAPELLWGYPRELLIEIAEVVGNLDDARSALDCVRDAGLLKRGWPKA